MKPVIIIAMIVAIGIISVIVVIQQSEISDIRRQEYLESSVVQCNMIILNVNMFSNDAVNQARVDWENCFDDAMVKYGNSFQKENWELQKQQVSKDWQTGLKTSDNTSNFGLDEYWALRYKEVSDPIKQQSQNIEIQEKREEMDSCLENASLIECMKITTKTEIEEEREEEEREKPTCLSPNYRLKEYIVHSLNYVLVDKNRNGFYCEYYDSNRDQILRQDDEGLK